MTRTATPELAQSQSGGNAEAFQAHTSEQLYEAAADSRFNRTKGFLRERLKKPLAATAALGLSFALASGAVHTYNHIEHYQTATTEAVHTVDSIASILRSIGYDFDYATADTHCSMGDVAMVPSMVKAANPRIYIDLGDFSDSGRWYELPCIHFKYNDIDPSINTYAVLGNHDTYLTGKQLKSYGVNVLDGIPEEGCEDLLDSNAVPSSDAHERCPNILADGTKIYGATDPTLKQFGSYESKLKDPNVTLDSFKESVHNDIETLDPDIVFIHDRTQIEGSSAEQVISGHGHYKSILADIVDDKVHVQMQLNDNAGKVGGQTPLFEMHENTSSQYLLVFEKNDPTRYVGYIEINIRRESGGTTVVWHSPLTRFLNGEVIKTGDDFLDAAIAK